jgi:integrase
MSKREKLPRGLHYRGESIVCTFAFDGRIVRRALGDVSVSWAKEELARFKRQVRQGEYKPRRSVAPAAKETVYTVGDLWNLYVCDRELAGTKAIWRQKIAWQHLKPTFAAMRAEHVTTAQIKAYMQARLAEGASNATVNRELSAVSAALYHAARMTGEGGKPLLAHVPTFPSKLTEAPPRKGFIGEKEYAILAANAKPLWLRTLIALAYAYGFRKSEMLGLRCSQVDLAGGWVQLYGEDTKNGEGRKVKLTRECALLLAACKEGKGADDYIFTREDGKHVVDPRDDWYTLCVASGLGQLVSAKRADGEEYEKYVGLILHDFRRSAIRNMDRRGVPQTIAMKISGHRSVSVWRRYNLGDERDLEQATQKIEAGREVHPAETDTKTNTSTSGVSPLPS